MFKVSDILTTPPPAYATELQQKVYETLTALSIPFERVDTDPGLTMEDCQHIDAKIGVRIVKTIFLCNRQQTEFYLYVTTDDKPFVTREFCSAAILPQAEGVHLVMDRGVAEAPFYACTDGTATCFLKLRTSDLLERFLYGKAVVLI